MAKQDLGWAWKSEYEVDRWLAKAEKRVARKARSKTKKKRRGLAYAPSKKFYRSKRWRTLRRKVLETYGYKCMQCRSVDSIMHVDHIIPRAWRPDLSFFFENLQVLCERCNVEKSAIFAHDFREESIAEDLDLGILAEARKRI